MRSYISWYLALNFCLTFGSGIHFFSIDMYWNKYASNQNESFLNKLLMTCNWIFGFWILIQKEQKLKIGRAIEHEASQQESCLRFGDFGRWHLKKVVHVSSADMLDDNPRMNRQLVDETFDFRFLQAYLVVMFKKNGAQKYLIRNFGHFLINRYIVFIQIEII